MYLVQNLTALVLLAFFFVAPVSGQSDDPFGPASSASDDPFAYSLTEAAPTAVQGDNSSGSPQRETRKTRSIVNDNDGVRKRLEEHMNLNYDEIPWGEIQEDLSRSLRFNIILTSSAEDDSLSYDEPLTVNLASVRGKDAIRTMLKKKNATYKIEGGMMKIISLDDSDDVAHFSTQVFNIKQLLAKVSVLEKDRIGKLKHSPKSLLSTMQVDHSSKPQIEDGAEVAPVPAQTMKVEKFLSPDDLISAESIVIDLIQSTVAPDSWYDTGQGLGAIKGAAGCLVVSNSQKVVDDVGDFLGELLTTMSKE